MTLSRTAFINTPPEIKEELLTLFNNSEHITIFDIGACEGEDSIRYSKLFPNSSVFLFEPRPDNLKIVHENIAHFQCNNIHVSNLALSSENGKATFYLSSGNPNNLSDSEDWDFGNKSSSLLPPGEEMQKHTEWLEFNNTLDVTTIKLIDFCKENNISKIDFIHMDVQGAELMVLQGAESFIKNISAIWLEVEAVELYKGQPLKKDVEEFMQANGFVCVKSTVNNIAGDQLYINSKIISKEKITSVVAVVKKQQRNKRIKHIYYSIRNKFFGKK